MNKVKLGQAVDILDYKRIPVSSAERANREKVYPYYGAQGVVDYIDDYIFDGEYVLVAEDGNNLKTLSEPIVTWATGRFWVNNHAHIIGGNGTADIRYVYYYLMASDLRGLITGSAQPKLNQENLASFELELPGREAQVKIAEVLRSIDDKIALNKKIMTELEDTARLIYDYWFTQFDFPDENGKPYRSSGGKMVYNETLKREIPEGWEVKGLGEICSFKNGINYDKDSLGGNLCRIVNVRNITASSLFIDRDDLDELELPEQQIERYAITNADILIARSGTPGAVRLLQDPIDTIFCGFIICCTPNDDSLKDYVAFSLKQLEGTSATVTGGSILKNVSQDTLKIIKICIPPHEAALTFNHIADTLLAGIAKANRDSRQLIALRDWLLPMLMNGQVIVDV